MELRRQSDAAMQRSVGVIRDAYDDFKKTFKKMADNFAVREVAYFMSTKLGIEDRTEKSINSMVESNMKKLSLTDILKGDFDETLNKIIPI